MSQSADQLAARLLSNATLHLRQNAAHGERPVLDARNAAVIHAVAQEVSALRAELAAVKSTLHRLTTARDCE